ncbi:phasin family protein [Pontibacillus salicampi]|uniref:Phasin family protein n=1 Tax=Pontibacillus salicampi TaxID=1449801 RepID=A0ABV6LSC2_9BACI
MSDLLKKGFYIGLGAAVSGKERAQRMLDELVDKGQVTPKEAKEMLNSFKEKGEKQNEKWTNQSEGYFRNMIQELGFVTKEDYQVLESRIEALEEQLRSKE